MGLRFRLVLITLAVVLFALVPSPRLHAAVTPSVGAKVVQVESAIAGKPYQVSCVYTRAAWDTFLTQAGVPAPPPGAYIFAVTYVGTGPTILGNLVCSALSKPWQQLTAFQLGMVIDVLAHEPNHAWGVRNEADTEACAHRYEALVAHDLYGVAYHTATMRLMVNEALRFSSTVVLPSYQGGSCPR